MVIMLSVGRSRLSRPMVGRQEERRCGRQSAGEHDSEQPRQHAQQGILAQYGRSAHPGDEQAGHRYGGERTGLRTKVRDGGAVDEPAGVEPPIASDDPPEIHHDQRLASLPRIGHDAKECPQEAEMQNLLVIGDRCEGQQSRHQTGRTRHRCGVARREGTADQRCCPPDHRPGQQKQSEQTYRTALGESGKEIVVGLVRVGVEPGRSTGLVLIGPRPRKPSLRL